MENQQPRCPKRQDILACLTLVTFVAMTTALFSSTRSFPAGGPSEKKPAGQANETSAVPMSYACEEKRSASLAKVQPRKSSHALEREAL